MVCGYFAFPTPEESTEFQRILYFISYYQDCQKNTLEGWIDQFKLMSSFYVSWVLVPIAVL